MTQGHKPERLSRVPKKSEGLAGGNRLKWASLGNARVWMNLIMKDRRYARLIFMTAKEQREFDRTGIIPPPIRDVPLPDLD